MISHLRQPITPPISSQTWMSPKHCSRKTPNVGTGHQDHVQWSPQTLPTEPSLQLHTTPGWHLLNLLWTQRPFHPSLWPCFTPYRGWGDTYGEQMLSPSHIKSLNPPSTSSFAVTVKEGALLLVQERCEIEQNAPCARGHVPLWLPENFAPLFSH